jgi:hypothetical protein
MYNYNYFCGTTPTEPSETPEERKARLKKQAEEEKKRKEEEERFYKQCVKYTLIGI